MLRKMSNQKIETEIQQRWDRFHQWESKYEKERLKRLSSLEKLRICEGFYEEFLQLHGKGLP